MRLSGPALITLLLVTGTGCRTTGAGPSSQPPAQVPSQSRAATASAGEPQTVTQAGHEERAERSRWMRWMRLGGNGGTRIPLPRTDLEPDADLSLPGSPEPLPASEPDGPGLDDF